MPKYTIVAEDDTVVVDGKALKIDCSDLPEYVRAVQWDGEKGHIEYRPDAKGRQHGNVNIVDFTPFMFLVDRWTAERIKQDEELDARRRKRATEEQSAAMQDRAVNAKVTKAKTKKVR